MASKLFDDLKTYQVTDPELTAIASRERWSKWRCFGTGPAYYKLGRKVLYTGRDLNAWAEANRVSMEDEKPDAA